MNSYTIRRLWNKFRTQPQSTLPKAAPKVYKPVKKIILANRSDGLGERLCAMVNAIRLANYLGVDFRFHWPNQIWSDAYNATDKTTPAHMIGQSIAPIEDVFAATFIEKYALEQASEHDFTPIPKQTLSPIGLRQSDSLGWYTAQHHLEADYGKSVAEACTLSASDAFSKIEFSASASAVIHQARALDIGDFTALHLRSGDMVYGDVRRWGFWGNKVLNPIVAMDIIKKANAGGQKVVVFGQDLVWIRKIQKEHDVVVAHDLLDVAVMAPHLRALFELTLMARATKIIAGGSGFARAASMIGDKSVTSMFASHSPIRYSDVTIAGMNAVQDHIHPYMIAYSYWQAYAFGRTLRSVPQLISIIEKSHQHDPDNYLYLVILVALKYRMGDDQAAEDLLQEHYKQDPASPRSSEHPLNRQIIFRYHTPKYTHEEQFKDFIAAARRPGNTHAKAIAGLILADKS